MTINIPTKLEDWTLDVIKELADNYGVETETFDFKLGLQDSEHLTKTCCAFANTKGGFVVIGVGQRNGNFEIKGIEQISEIARDFGHRIKANPTIYFSPPHIINIDESTNKIVVIEIPLSPERPHINNISPGKRFFWMRTNTGCVQMTYEEIRMSFLNYQERRDKVILLYYEILSLKALIEGIEKDVQGPNNVSSIKLDPTTISVLLIDLISVISQDNNFMNSLMNIKMRLHYLDNEFQIFKSKLTIYGQDIPAAIRDHNNFVIAICNQLKPEIYNAMSILETRFGIIPTQDTNNDYCSFDNES